MACIHIIDSTLPLLEPAVPPTLFHSLPFVTPFEGETDVEANFHAAISSLPSGDEKEEAEALYSSQFRGRRLLGRRVRLPSGMSVALTSCERPKKKMKAEEEASAPQLVIVTSKEEGEAVPLLSPEWTTWAHDRPPALPNTYCQWIALSNAIHGDDEH